GEHGLEAPEVERLLEAGLLAAFVLALPEAGELDDRGGLVGVVGVDRERPVLRVAADVAGGVEADGQVERAAGGYARARGGRVVDGEVAGGRERPEDQRGAAGVADAQDARLVEQVVG